MGCECLSSSCCGELVASQAENILPNPIYSTMAHMYHGYQVIKSKFNDLRGPKFIFIPSPQGEGGNLYSPGA